MVNLPCTRDPSPSGSKNEQLRKKNGDLLNKRKGIAETNYHEGGGSDTMSMIPFNMFGQTAIWVSFHHYIVG